jgi:predicted HTH domain antitoxin
MSILISDEVIQASHLSSTEFRHEIAIHLFASDCLTIGYASQLAEMSSDDFRQLIGERNIPLYSYDLDDLELDLRNLKALGRL